jgi:thiamine pyrophosphokinase
MRAVVFANGKMDDLDGARSQIRGDDILIAADGGAAHCRRLGIFPAVIVGDLDSLSAEDRAFWETEEVEFIRHDPRKDETDLELALLHALNIGCREILVLGALGGRWDQTFANLLLPAYNRLDQAEISFWHDGTQIYLVRGERTIHGQVGQTLSLIPIGGDAHGVSAEGVEWPLKGETLRMGATRGVSNVFVRDEAVVLVEDGLLLCFVFDRID